MEAIYGLTQQMNPNYDVTVFEFMKGYFIEREQNLCNKKS